MGRAVAWTRAWGRLTWLLVISLGAGSMAWAQASPDATSPRPVGSVSSMPRIPGAADASDWLPGSPAAADSAAAGTAAADSARAAAGRTGSTAGDSLLPGAVNSIDGEQPTGGPSGSNAAHPGRTAPIQPSLPGSVTRSPAGLVGSSTAADRRLRLPPNTATGISIGYPAYPGLFVVAPADGSLAFRSGLTGFPTIGLLWTPGLEYRFGQERGTLSQNSIYAFGNAFLGRTYLEGEREYTGVEAGFGYRWFIDDRRGVRWIAAVEAGGYWRGDPVKPRRPCLRFIWTLVE